MRRIFIFVFISLFVGNLSSAPIRIGVYVGGTDEVEMNYKILLGDNLVEGLANNDQYIAVNRSKEGEKLLLQARQKQGEGNVDDSQILSMTNEWGETELLIVDILSFEGLYSFHAQLLDMEKNVTLRSTSKPLPKSEMKYEGIVAVAEYLLEGLGITPKNNEKIEDVNLISFQQKSRDVANARLQRAQEKYDLNCERNISYSRFRVMSSSDISNVDMASGNYFRKGDNLIETADYLFILMLAGAAVGGLVSGIAMEKQTVATRVGFALGMVGVSMIPSFCCYIAAAGNKRKAYRLYREPYKTADKELRDARKDALVGVRIAPVVGGDWAGAQLRISF